MEPPATKTEMAQPTPLGGGAQLAMPMPAVATSFQAAASQQAVVAMGGAGGDWPESTGTAEATFRKRGRPRKYEGLGEAERRKRRMADNRQSAKRCGSLRAIRSGAAGLSARWAGAGRTTAR
eukprot:COSAG04_NODE_155_length_22379_cov_5.613707_3_plen_122_part_00